MDTIAITGSAGLIGSHLCHRFIKLGWRVLGIDNLIGGYETNMPADSNFFFYNIDILNNKELSTILKEYSPKIIIHCAALAHEGLSVFAPKTIVENIYSGTASVCSAAIQAGAAIFINTSSMARYGDGQPPFLEDETIPQPVDPYGLAKLHAEQHLYLMSDIHKIKVVTMVPHNVCGPHQCYSDPFRNVMSIFANQLKRQKPIYIYGNGQQKRSFSHVEDCIDAFEEVVKHIDTISSGEVFNIGPDDGTEITIEELAHGVAKYFNVSPNIEYLPARPREVKNAWVSTKKAKNILNYTTKYSTEDVIRDTTSWMKNQPLRDFNYHLDLEIITDNTPITWTNRIFNK